MGKVRIRHLLVAGGAGFLGSAFARDRLRADPEILITALDAVRRPGADGDLADLADDRRFKLVRGDVLDRAIVDQLAGEADAIINFASEEFTGSGASDGPTFARSDIEGTAVLLEAARKFQHQRFLLVSTGEVYGPLKSSPNREEDRIAPRSLAAGARAAAEALAGAYHAGHGVPVLITRGAAAYGPRQPVNQPIASLITSALTGQTVFVDGHGSGTRDYLHVDDLVAGIARVLWKGEPGSVYNIGAAVQVSGSQLAETILESSGKPASLKRLTKEGPDWSYAMDTKRMRPLGWDPQIGFAEGIRLTVEWYRRNEAWWRLRDTIVA
ncbi:MAG TPA: NAD-dependent epimerase/dehydratase family protein [Candidatus Binatus sp.]|nr:NAD-dependent epimerase/dehydratase family protein [Candidatus Binatus sp.]